MFRRRSRPAAPPPPGAALDARWRVHVEELLASAQAAERTVSSLDVDKVRDQLKDARRRLARLSEGSPDRMRIAEEERLLGEQYASLNQLANAIDEAGGRLRLLDLRLDAAVARVAQIVLRPDAPEALGDVDKELDGVVTELDALRAGLDAVGSLEP